MDAPLSSEPVVVVVEARAHGWRIDHYLTRLFPNYSRAMFQKAIEQHAVVVNGLPVKMSRRLRVNDVVSVRLPSLPDQTLPAEDIPLDVIYEDEHLVVINKPAGLIVHPGKGNYGGTLAGALQFHFDRLSDVAGRFRPGIVHRLDRDTSGLLLVAKDNQVHHRLSAQFERREVLKEYRAIAWGVVDFDSDFIETSIRVHPKVREKMMVCEPGGNAREAVTFYEVLERFPHFTYLRLLPKTGRTHQLRVHMQHLGHPLVADRLYGGRATLELQDITATPGGGTHPTAPAASSHLEGEELAGAAGREVTSNTLIARQALHAFRIEFQHPVTLERMTFEAPLPDDMQKTLEALQNEERKGMLER
jgi:23S rRNA pseudouridine1911/1915/1917 synthase